MGSCARPRPAEPSTPARGGLRGVVLGEWRCRVGEGQGTGGALVGSWGAERTRQHNTTSCRSELSSSPAWRRRTGCSLRRGAIGATHRSAGKRGGRALSCQRPSGTHSTCDSCGHRQGHRPSLHRGALPACMVWPSPRGLPTSTRGPRTGGKPEHSARPPARGPCPQMRRVGEGPPPRGWRPWRTARRFPGHRGDPRHAAVPHGRQHGPLPILPNALLHACRPDHQIHAARS